MFQLTNPESERSSEPAAAVFLDRDDTLIANREVTADSDHPGDLVDPALVRLLPGAAEACAALAQAGNRLVVITNQGGVARGVCGIEQMARVNERVAELVEREAGVRLDAIVSCPYHPKGSVAEYAREHEWRKPVPGMIFEARERLNLDLSRSWLVGDAERDIEAGARAGITEDRLILIGGAASGVSCLRAADLGEAAGLIGDDAR